MYGLVVFYALVHSRIEPFLYSKRTPEEYNKFTPANDIEGRSQSCIQEHQKLQKS